MSYQGSGRGFRIPAGIVDSPATREIVEIFRRFIQENPLLSFRGRIITFRSNASSGLLTIPHGLSFRPKHTMLIKHPYLGGYSEFHYDKFDDKNIVFDPSAVGDYEALVGSYGD